ncbi:hypothetical protein [Hymenobacter profundi]|uniref:DUF2892 domain-containing protein n=1 Tax=Hymenobacter profundi TaxID=1982110 RepID=A0ABS6WUN4_9BACT|nr:hypothetical protein [Hymenobacter profundi]MBW3127285.1 hypothetical protein [Hymenobacter profundi]
MSILDRVALPSPKFWRKVSAVGKAVGGLGLVIVTAPVALPAAVLTAAGYLVLVGSLTAGLSALTVEPKTAEPHDQSAGDAGTQ